MSYFFLQVSSSQAKNCDEHPSGVWPQKDVEPRRELLKAYFSEESEEDMGQKDKHLTLDPSGKTIWNKHWNNMDHICCQMHWAMMTSKIFLYQKYCCMVFLFPYPFVCFTGGLFHQDKPQLMIDALLGLVKEASHRGKKLGSFNAWEYYDLWCFIMIDMI